MLPVHTLAAASIFIFLLENENANRVRLLISNQVHTIFLAEPTKNRLSLCHSAAELQLAVPVIRIFLSNRADHPAGVSRCHNIGGNILCDHASRADDSIIPDGHPRTDHHTSPDPDLFVSLQIEEILINYP